MTNNELNPNILVHRNTDNNNNNNNNEFIIRSGSGEIFNENENYNMNDDHTSNIEFVSLQQYEYFI
jgi:hypothetical protein